MDDHDQRIKGLLRAFFADFLYLFFPDWAARLDPERAEFQDQEAFLDPPQGERRLLDLVVRVPSRAAVSDPAGRADDAWYILVNVEVESPDRVAPFRPRMFTYYQALRQRHQAPVWPVALFLRAGLDGVGWDAYEERLWGRTLLRFEYAYFGLPALDGPEYLSGPSLLGVALAALMRLPAERRAELKLEAMQRVASSGEDDAWKYMLAECLEAYFPLDAAEAEEYERLTHLERGREVTAMTVSWIEQRIKQGVEQERRQLLEKLLIKKFGAAGERVAGKVQGMAMDQLEQTLLALVDAKSLDDLGFNGDGPAAGGNP
jgi:hypothetical protein